MIAALFIIAVVVVYFHQKEEEGISLEPVLNPDAKLQALAQAIAYAENGASLTNTRHNPGNIRSLETGAIDVFADEDTGWQRLYNKLVFDFVSGGSTIYSASMTWLQVGWMWVAGTAPGGPHDPRDNPDSWAATVAGKLGVNVQTTVGEYLT